MCFCPVREAQAPRVKSNKGRRLAAPRRNSQAAGPQTPKGATAHGSESAAPAPATKGTRPRCARKRVISRPLVCPWLYCVKNPPVSPSRHRYSRFRLSVWAQGLPLRQRARPRAASISQLRASRAGYPDCLSAHVKPSPPSPRRSRRRVKRRPRRRRSRSSRVRPWRESSPSRARRSR